MINNIPKAIEFERLGVQCIAKSFDMLFELGNKYSELAKNETLKNEITEVDFWNHHNIAVRTSLIVLFQGIEYLMKMEVTKESALLLIEINKVDWPSLPQKKDKDFDQLPTISGESLLSVFCALPNNKIDLKEFEKNYEELRINRNKLVHSTGVSGIEHPFLIKKVLFFMSAFYEPSDWIDLFRENYTLNPGFGYWDWTPSH